MAHFRIYRNRRMNHAVSSRKLKVLAMSVALLAFCGCRTSFLAPRSGMYFQSTRLAAGNWGYAGREPWSGGRLSCFGAGFMLLPTVVGPLYYWGVRPVVDTVDVTLVSPVVDTTCLPYDYVVNHWQRRAFLFVDPDGKPVSGVNAQVVETGELLRSDDDGRMSFVAKDHVTLRVDTSQFYCRQSPDINSVVMKEYVSGLRIPRVIEHTIEVLRKNHVARRNIHAVRLFMPGLDTDYGFDCLEGDWVSPHGLGSATDLVFRASGNSYSGLHVDVRLPNDGLSGFMDFRTGSYREPLLRTWGSPTNLLRTVCIDKWEQWQPVAFRSHVQNGNDAHDIYAVIDDARIRQEDRYGACEIELHLSVNSQRGNDSFEWEDHLARTYVTPVFKFSQSESCVNGLPVRGFYGRPLWVTPKALCSDKFIWLSVPGHDKACDKHHRDGSPLDGPQGLDGKYIRAIDASPGEFVEALGKVNERPYLVQSWHETLSRSFPAFKSENLKLLWNSLHTSKNEIDRSCAIAALLRPEMPNAIKRLEFENACKEGNWPVARLLVRDKGAFQPEERRHIYHNPQYALFRYYMAVQSCSGWIDYATIKLLREKGTSLVYGADENADEKSVKSILLHELLEATLPKEAPNDWP